jgi:ABC-type Fe3+-hydroxamate transport system substrate-binding protein
MKTNMLKWSVISLAPAAMLALVSCSSNSSTPAGLTSSSAVYQPGVPGGVMVDTFKITATVTGIDATNRKVTLVTQEGKKTTVKCGPEVINFDQIRVGDQLKVAVTEELAVSMAPEGAPPSDGGVTAVVLAPKGAKPGGIVANTVQVTATVKAIDLKHHKATLEFPDGTTKTVAVRKDVDLTQRQVGEKVSIRTTETLAILVEKP